MSKEISRRQFLKGIVGLGGFLLLSPLEKFAPSEQESEEFARFPEVAEKKKGFFYVVSPGSNLSKIAAWLNKAEPFYPDSPLSWQEIYEENKDIIGKNPNLIKPNQKLFILPPDFKEKPKPEESQVADWILRKMSKSLSLADFSEQIGVFWQKIAEVNGFEKRPEFVIREGQEIKIPTEAGIFLTEEDKEKGIKWLPKFSVSFSEYHWQSPYTGEWGVAPLYPNRAYVIIPYERVYWAPATWSTAEFWLPEEDFKIEKIKKEIVEVKLGDYEGKETARYLGFKVEGFQKIVHTTLQLSPAGRWSCDPEFPGLISI